MVITFCGHSKFVGNSELEEKLLSLLDELAGDGSADFYLGGYGAFDSFAYNCCKKFKEKNPLVKLIFITPYINKNLEYEKEIYDEIIYPEIEDKPLRFAISYRNKWMVEKSDFVIAYVTETYGGAYQTYKHAKRKRKPIFNLSGKDI